VNRLGRRLTTVGLLLAAPVLLVGCARAKGPDTATTEAASGVPQQAPNVQQQAWEWIRSGAQLLDVRTPEEFAAGHLPGARNLPYDQVRSRVAELGPDRDARIVVYCRSGRRSGLARDALRELGFRQVLNGGGYDALQQDQP
jgi:phage shock protein E